MVKMLMNNVIKIVENIYEYQNHNTFSDMAQIFYNIRLLRLVLYEGFKLIYRKYVLELDKDTDNEIS